MRIASSATRHGISIEEIEHAVRNFVYYFGDQGSGGLVMLVGPARDGRMLEIGIVEDAAESRVVHAMHARAKYWPKGR